MNTQAQEILLTIPGYIAQLAESNDRAFSYEHLPEALAGERILNTWLRITITRLVWTLLLDYPMQQEIHPAITLVRDQGGYGRVVDVLIAEDLSAWLQPAYQASIPIDFNRGGDPLDLGVAASV
jgi:hypothetical protein